MTRNNNSNTNSLFSRMTLDGSDCKQRSLVECMQFIMEVINTLKVSLRSQTVYEFNDYKFNDCESEDLMLETLPGIIITTFSQQSSLSLHTFSFIKKASLNIFSTKPFPRKVIEKAFRYFFKPGELLVGGN